MLTCHLFTAQSQTKVKVGEADVKKKEKREGEDLGKHISGVGLAPSLEEQDEAAKVEKEAEELRGELEGMDFTGNGMREKDKMKENGKGRG